MTTKTRPDADLIGELGDDPAWSLRVAQVVALDLGMADVAERCAEAADADGLADTADEAASAAWLVATTGATERRARVAESIAAGSLPALVLPSEADVADAHRQRAVDVRRVADQLAALALAPVTGDDDALLATVRALAERGWGIAANEIITPRALRFERGWWDSGYGRNYLTALGDKATELDRLLAARHKSPSENAQDLARAVAGRSWVMPRGS